MLKNGVPIGYGARVISTGGFQAIPKLTVPGALLVGCAAGFLNVPRIKGTHTAMKSGMVAADAIADKLKSTDNVQGAEVSDYEDMIKSSWIWSELKAVRNAKPAFKKFGGTLGGMMYSGLELLMLKGREPWTFHNKSWDADRTRPAESYSPPSGNFRPDNRISFDLLTNLQRSGVRHEEDQPGHLRFREGKKSSFPVEESLKVYGGPEQYFCPAKVYEYVDAGAEGRKLQINAANCVHCKTCDIKTPGRFIRWTVPEGGGGPSYTNL
uniref:Electron transfer flavoprotein-ubiquinone oxidoreductase n=2 Tax=Spongospora subterranea TaxID=70186 RepID=A0A0H5QGQ7_9EUKA|eukprot:CRZ01155.1 hypothetical protein [Spongospora subterranea]